MSMPAIERVIPLVSQLPASIREALARRVVSYRLGLIALCGVGGGGADDMSVQDRASATRHRVRSRNIVGYPARSAPIS